MTTCDLETSKLSTGTVISAPGKVLLTGGYLILDPAFSGLVLSIDARFKVQIIKSISTNNNNINARSNAGSLGDHRKSCFFHVNSPQFTDGCWDYEFNLIDGAKNPLLPTTPTTDASAAAGAAGLGQPRNKFVESALEITMIYILSTTSHSIIQDGEHFSITIEADNDFYSQLHHLKAKGLSTSIQSLSQLPKYLSTNSTIAKVAKTGLGSSAAMITSLTFALLLHFEVVHQSNEKIEGLDIIHNLAQASHCLAQGKIGSGFDVSSAIYGSHIYQRFSPSLLHDLLFDSDDISSEVGSKRRNHIVKIASSKWDHKITPFSLPSGLQIQLGDINSGSNTPKMVSKVLDWKSKNTQQCNQLWGHISLLNGEIVSLFKQLDILSKENEEFYNSCLEQLSLLPVSEWQGILFSLDESTSKTVYATFIQLHLTFVAVRKLMKELGVLADVEIEPDQQSSLLNDCLALPGVMAAGVPGAGGYDAIFCICLGKKSRQSLLDSWRDNTVSMVTPIISPQSHHGLLVEHKL